jgi:hypothetical protein
VSQPDVQAVSRSLALALNTNGESLPITNWFVGDGDGWPSDSDEADQAVAGPDREGKWYRIDLTMFTESRHRSANCSTAITRHPCYLAAGRLGLITLEDRMTDDRGGGGGTETPRPKTDTGVKRGKDSGTKRGLDKGREGRVPETPRPGGGG